MVDRIRETPDIVGEDTRTFALSMANSRRFRGRMPSPDMRSEPVALTPPLVPIVAHGYWMAICPWCGGGENVMKSDPVFYCLHPACPRPHGASFIAVSFPKDRTLKAAEKLLLARRMQVADQRTGEKMLGPTVPDYERRAWYPETESVAELRRQNKAMGF